MKITTFLSVNNGNLGAILTPADDLEVKVRDRNLC